VAGKPIASKARLSPLPLKAGLGPARLYSRSPCTEATLLDLEPGPLASKEK
jgi:hypothetical protein